MPNRSIAARDTLPGTETAHLYAGRFLMLSRYPDAPGGAYAVRGAVPAQRFLDRMGMAPPPRGDLLGWSLSDLCVEAFDKRAALGMAPACVAFQAADGRVIHQHST